MNVGRRIRVISPAARPTFGESLEQRAGDILARSRMRDRSDAVAATVENEIALAVDHLRRLRDFHGSIARDIVRQECYLGTEIIQREPRAPVYVDPRLPERDRLRDRLRSLSEEKRRWLARYVERRQDLLDRLQRLLTRRALLHD